MLWTNYGSYLFNDDFSVQIRMIAKIRPNGKLCKVSEIREEGSIARAATEAAVQAISRRHAFLPVSPGL
jgi:hypothetical protein